MAVLRNPNHGKFTVVDNFALRDQNLSLKARGLLVTMLSLPDNWEFSENGLCTIFKKDGQASIRSGLKELEENGYLIRQRTRDDRGRVSKVDWTVYDYPHLENPSMDNPSLEVRPQLNTKKLNTEESNTEELKPQKKSQNRFIPPTLEEVQAYCFGRYVDPQQFIDFYESKGWMVGSNKMKDWKAAVRTWDQRSKRDRLNGKIVDRPTPSGNDFLKREVRRPLRLKTE